MQVAVLYAGFAFAVGAFGVWLVVMLRQDRTHRYALAAEAQERTRAHRQAALTARSGPAATRSTPAAGFAVPGTPVIVARAGAYCRVPGTLGLTKAGERLVCQPTGGGRPRWRRPVTLKIAG